MTTTYSTEAHAGPSRLSALLRDRVLSDAGDQAAPGVPMTRLAPGATARVVGLDDELDPATARRLFDLGFVPGSEVVVVRRAPMADPVIFRVAGFEMALRRAQARGVLVAAEPRAQV